MLSSYDKLHIDNTYRKIDLSVGLYSGGQLFSIAWYGTSDYAWRQVSDVLFTEEFEGPDVAIRQSLDGEVSAGCSKNNAPHIQRYQRV
jgi:hypothetical protein